MELTPEVKKRIDEMSFGSMLSKWRFAPVGNPMFQGESGDYFSKVMAEKDNALKVGEHAAASKAIGW